MAYRLLPSRALAAAAIAVAALSAGACTATVNQRGYLPQDAAKFSAVRPGVDTRDSVAALLGSPSNVSTFGDSVWYYVSDTQEDFMFFRPETVDRQIVAIAFAADGRVARVERSGLENGVDVAFSDDETPTKGREMTILQQLFGTIGRGAPVGVGGEGDTGRDRR